MRSTTALPHALCLLLLLAPPLFAGCDSGGGGTSRGPKPATSFTYDDDQSPGIDNLGGDLTMRSCGYAVRDPNKDRYFADGQADTEGSPSTLVVYFPDTNQSKPAPGTLVVPDHATVKITLPSPYGVLNATAGTVKITEADGWRVITLKDTPVSGTRYSGTLNATLACGL